jgi:hypothetical protein
VLIIKLLKKTCTVLVVKYYWNVEVRSGCAILWMSSAKNMKKFSLLLKKLLRRLITMDPPPQLSPRTTVTALK